MTTHRSILPTALGFAFVAVAFGQGFWIAVACLLGALVFHVGNGLYRGDLTFGELQERAEAARSGFARAASPDHDSSSGAGGSTQVPRPVGGVPSDAPRPSGRVV